MIVLLVWLTIGVGIGGWISIDSFRRKVKGAKWVVAGVFLSVIGLAIYLRMRDRTKKVKHPEHQAPPEYRYSEPAGPEVRPVPRDGATVEPSPDVPPAPEPDQSGPAQQRSQGPLLPTPDGSRPEYRPTAHVLREQVEGIPRCPNCGAAVSAKDELCSECGAKLK